MTDPGDRAWQQYNFNSVIDGKPYDSAIRVELKNKRDGGGKRKDDAPPPRALRRQ